MSELHKFLFEGLPVRGMLVRLTDGWQEALRRRADTDPFDAPVRKLLGEMSAAGVLMQANIKFNGAVVLQIFGDGPVKVAVTEVQPDLSFRSTAKLVGELPASDNGHLPLEEMVNVHGQGRCAITLDPKDRLPGQQPYQGVVPLHGDLREPLHELSQVLEHYMLQSEQLDTKLWLAADLQFARGLLLQKLPDEGGKAIGQAQTDGDGHAVFTGKLDKALDAQSSSKPLCACRKGLQFWFGVKVSYWSPNRMVDVVTEPSTEMLLPFRCHVTILPAACDGSGETFRTPRFGNVRSGGLQ